MNDLPLPEHFFERELIYLPLKAGKGALIGAGTVQQTDPSRVSTRNYRTDEYSGVLLLKGGGFFEVEERIIPLEEGMFFQRIPGITHSTYPDKDGSWSEFFITLPSSLYRSLEKVGVIDSSRFVFSPSLSQELLGLAREIKEFFRTGRTLDGREILPKILEFILQCQSGKGNRTAPGFEEFVIYLQNRLRSGKGYSLELPSLCAEWGMGYEKFRKDFKNRYAMPPGAYMKKYRMEEAARRLREQNLSIKEVSLDLGFPDLPTFSRQFKSVFGQPPSLWLGLKEADR